MIKRHKIVMVPSKNSDRGALGLRLNSHNKLLIANNMLSHAELQYLYILSDEEIKEGDWYLVQHNIEGEILSNKLILCKANKNFILNHYIKTSNLYSKIIATTNPELHWKGSQTASSISIPNVPKISKVFISNYIEMYNSGKPIILVSVEYEPFYYDDIEAREVVVRQDGYILKKDSDNNAFIFPSIQDYLFSREEVIKILEDYRPNAAKLMSPTEWFNEWY